MTEQKMCREARPESMTWVVELLIFKSPVWTRQFFVSVQEVRAALGDNPQSGTMLHVELVIYGGLSDRPFVVCDIDITLAFLEDTLHVVAQLVVPTTSTKGRNGETCRVR
jgi:hypothetical protein